MRLLEKIGSMLMVFCRLLGARAGTGMNDTKSGREAPRTIAVPAVASFVARVWVDRFLLARRLASVARLNVPTGRKPWSTRRPSTGLPPVPAARLGAKKVRHNTNRGLRVLVAKPARPRMTAEVIPFPARETAAEPAALIAKAA